MGTPQTPTGEDTVCPRAGSSRPPAVTLLVLAEIVLAAAIVVVLGWADLRSRTAGPESAFTAYAAALAREDLDGALGQLAPELRTEAASFVEWQLGNRLLPLESAVRTGSWLDRLAGSAASYSVVVVTLEVHELGTAPWRTVQELPVELVDGHWRLLKVPLQPPDAT